jgi:hypothetical protein
MEVLYRLSYVGAVVSLMAEWGEQDSNLRRLSHAVYSRTPLAARTSPRAVNATIVEAPRAYEASLSRCASGRPSSFFSVLFSIWRIRSRVTPKARPTSSSVRAFWPRRP